MAKNIRWQIPFESIQGVQYRVDIYDEGEFTPVELTAGPTPFVTNEDASDDFFHPVRTQTGTLQVCTQLPSGGMITLNDLLPENNISRPVRLVSIATNNTETIEWQGFLSCEAYSQDYVGIPQILDIPVISVLEAMDSVQVNMNRNSGLSPICAVIYHALNEINIQSGISLFTYINYSITSWRIFQKMIDQTILFDQKEYNNENSTTYIASGLSAKKVLELVCSYMGWTAREQGIEIFFEYIGENIGMYRRSFSDFERFEFLPTSSSIIMQDIENFYWRGTGHQRSIAAGAKSVEVVAKLEKYNLDMSLPSFPYGETVEQYLQVEYNPDIWQYLLASLNTTPYSQVSLRFYKATLSMVYGTQTAASESTIEDTLSHRFYAGGIVDIYSGHGTETVYAGAFFAKVSFDEQQQASHQTQNGINAVWLQKINSDFNTQPIFSMSSILSYNMIGGYIKLSTSMAHIVVNYDNHYEVVWLSKEDQWTDKILMHIKIGNKYWDGTSWTTTESKVWVDIDGANFKNNWDPSMPVEETDGYLIQLNDNSGEVEIAIYPQNNPTHSNAFLCETFFSQLSVDYLSLDDDTLTGRSENHYFRLLDTNFRDEINISTELASMLNNLPSPSLIMNNATAMMKELEYTTSGGTESRRPEVDLLDRLAIYYGSARQRLELEVEHPTAAPLPLLKLNGINDGKVYLPLAESRDWKQDVSTITCFEEPEEPAES